MKQKRESIKKWTNALVAFPPVIHQHIPVWDKSVKSHQTEIFNFK